MFDSLVAAPEEAALSQCRPSGWLALELDSSIAAPTGTNDADLVEAMIAFDRVASWAAARQARVLAEFARRRPDDDPAAARSSIPSVASEFAPDEVGMALRLSRVAARARLDQAVMQSRVLPEVLLAWEHGVVDGVKVRAIVEACRVLPADLARAVACRVLPRAGEQTVGSLRAALARAVIAVDPEGAAERHRQARRERRVVLGAEPEGMASLWALLPAPDAVAAHRHLGVLARALGAADPRGMDARRADLMADLLTGRRCALTYPDSPGRCAEDVIDTRGATCPDMDTGTHTGGGTDANGSDDGGPVDGCPASAVPGGDPAGVTRGGGSAQDRADDARGGRWWASRRGGRPDRAGRPGSRGAATAAQARMRPPTVHVTVPITMLVGLDQSPGELRGYGPVPAPLAREIAAGGTWTRLLTDPAPGALLDHGRTTTPHPPGWPTTSAPVTSSAAPRSAAAPPQTRISTTRWPGTTAAPPASTISTPAAATTTDSKPTPPTGP